MTFPNLERMPTEAQLQKAAAEKVKRNLFFWNPFITGLAVLSEETVKTATPFEMLVLQEVMQRRENYLNTRIVKAELVERK